MSKLSILFKYNEESRLKTVFKEARRMKRNLACAAVTKLKKFDSRDPLIIFSDPRGGSTWVMEVINRIPWTAVIWEPLQIDRVDQFKKLGFAWRQFIPENAEWPEAQATFAKLFKGKMLNNWMCNPTSPLDFLRAEQLIVKFCRANGMIPWLTKNFQFNYAPIYLVRHPFSVAASQLKHGSWDYEFNGFEIPACRFGQPYVDHRDFLLSLRTKEEALVATWCLTNMVPLNHERNDRDWITVYYEDLITHPEQGFKRIFDRWKMPMPKDVIAQAEMPSARSKEITFTESIGRQLSKWKNFFNDNQIEKMVEVLVYFKVKHYGLDVMPIK